MWERSLTADHRAAFTELITAWQNWEGHILAYFNHPVTNLYRLNSLIRAPDRLGRGYSVEALRAKMLWAEGVTKTRRRRPLERHSPLRDQARPIGRAQLARPPLRAPDVSAVRFDVGIDLAALSRRLETGQL